MMESKFYGDYKPFLKCTLRLNVVNNPRFFSLISDILCPNIFIAHIRSSLADLITSLGHFYCAEAKLNN